MVPYLLGFLISPQGCTFWVPFYYFLALIPNKQS
jgi:hypothetical protein